MRLVGGVGERTRGILFPIQAIYAIYRPIEPEIWTKVVMTRESSPGSRLPPSNATGKYNAHG
jgi:hypothetical protein